MAKKNCPSCFKMLSERNRAAIISALQKKSQNVGDLVKRLGIGQPTVSHHLFWLKKTRMIKSEKQGRRVFYSLNKKYPCQRCNILRPIKL